MIFFSFKSCNVEDTNGAGKKKELESQRSNQYTKNELDEEKKEYPPV